MLANTAQAHCLQRIVKMQASSIQALAVYADLSVIPCVLPCPQQPWEACKVKKRHTVAAGGSITVRRLLSEFSVARQQSGEQGEQLLREAVASAVSAAAAARQHNS
jgi:hypothetical protein